MRLIADRAGILTYAIDYQLAPEAKFPVQIDEIEYFVRWLFDNADAQGGRREQDRCRRRLGRRQHDLCHRAQASR
jgi:acetyl esterase/lipase